MGGNCVMGKCCSASQCYPSSLENRKSTQKLLGVILLLLREGSRFRCICFFSLFYFCAWKGKQSTPLINYSRVWPQDLFGPSKLDWSTKGGGREIRSTPQAESTQPSFYFRRPDHRSQQCCKALIFTLSFNSLASRKQNKTFKGIQNFSSPMQPRLALNLLSQLSFLNAQINSVYQHTRIKSSPLI